MSLTIEDVLAAYATAVCHEAPYEGVTGQIRYRGVIQQEFPSHEMARSLSALLNMAFNAGKHASMTQLAKELTSKTSKIDLAKRES